MPDPASNHVVLAPGHRAGRFSLGRAIVEFVQTEANLKGRT
jgi:hypothetical protein